MSARRTLFRGSSRPTRLISTILLLCSFVWTGCEREGVIVDPGPVPTTFNIALGGSADERCVGILPTPDGGCIVIAEEKVPVGIANANTLLIKLGTRGTPEWRRTHGDVHTFPRGGALLTDNGLAVAGKQTDGTASYAFLIRTDNNGNALWQRNYGDSTETYSYESIGVAQSTGGNLLLLVSQSTAQAPGWTWVYAVSADGDILWTRPYGIAGLESATKIVALPDGGFVLFGTTRKLDSGGNLWLVRVDAAGNIASEKAIGTGSGESGRAIARTPAGDFIMTAIRYNESGSLVYKTDSTGSTLWSARLSPDLNDDLISVAVLPSGQYIGAGSSLKNGLLSGWIAKFSENGAAVWHVRQAPGTSNAFTSVAVSSVNNDIIAGGSFKSNAEKGDQVWVVRFDKDGNAPSAVTDTSLP